MTNTRLTDPEVLEFRYPVMLEDFHIRPGSGGRGKWNAGDGVSRTIRFLERMDCTILSGHRRVRPFGLAGGKAGRDAWAAADDLVLRKIAQAGLSGLSGMISGTPADAPPAAPAPGRRGPAVASAEQTEPGSGSFSVSSLSYTGH